MKKTDVERKEREKFLIKKIVKTHSTRLDIYYIYTNKVQVNEKQNKTKKIRFSYFNASALFFFCFVLYIFMNTDYNNR